jgi:hypothetical protein
MNKTLKKRLADFRINWKLVEGVTMNTNRDIAADHKVQPLELNEAQSPYKATVWRQLTPGERLRRSWEMRSRLPDPRAVHDRKLFPKP